MPRRPVVVDGSNLATEGRSLPSLAQLDEAVRAWLAENPDDEVIVVVDASFGYRIDESEKAIFEEAEEAGEVVSPPAGALGRGDGFLLKIADRVDAAVLSNDSFQEFHGEYPWLFDSGRLLGGKPVPGVGWIFTPRTPVRGPKSRMAVRDAERSKKTATRSEPVVEAIAEATAEALEPARATRSRRGRRRGSAGNRAATEQQAVHEAINEPLPFITFIAEHRLGTEVEGEVNGFSSHGAFVVADGARCYVPVSGLGDPPPRTAKAVLKKGETRRFVVQALDPPRRGIELALPGLARVAGAPTDETVEAEINAGATRARPAKADTPAAGGAPAPRRRRRGRATEADETPEVAPDGDEAPVSVGEAAGPAAVAVEPTSAPGPEEQPPSAPRRRRPAKKAAAAELPEAEALPEAEPEPPAPRRRRPAKKAAAAELPVPEAEAEAEPAPRRRRPAKKAAADVPVPAPEAEADPAPRRRRPAKKAAAPDVPEAEALPAPGAKPAAPRRRPAKKAAADVPSEPAPRRRRPAKKAATAVAGEQPIADEATPAAPRRRAAKKATTASGPAEPPPGPEAETGAPARSAKKAASRRSTKKVAKMVAAEVGESGTPPPTRRRRPPKAGG